jgi:cell division protein FtsB
MKSPLLAWLARLGVTAIGGTFAILIAVQYARIIERNVAYVQQVHDVERDVSALEQKRDKQLRQIQRLSDPQGAIPEIHDRLHMVGDHETIIYLKRHDAGPSDP